MRKFLISLVLLLGGTASQAALVNYFGDFGGNVSSMETISGTWSILFDESAVGPGSNFITGDLIPTAFMSTGGLPIDSSKVRVKLSFTSGAISSITVGGSINGSSGIAPGTDDFWALYSASSSSGGELVGLLSSVATESTVQNAGNRSGSFTASVVPIPTAVWLFSSGLLALMGLSRRKKAT